MPHLLPLLHFFHPLTETQRSTPATRRQAVGTRLLVLHRGGGGVGGAARPVQPERVHGCAAGAAGSEAAAVTHTVAGGEQRPQTHTQGPKGGPETR